MSLTEVVLPVGLFIAGICIGILIDWKKMKESNNRLDEMNNQMGLIAKKLGIPDETPKKFEEIIKHLYRNISESMNNYESVNIKLEKDGDKVTGSVEKDEI